jgi:ABC-type uncharacterized transport system, permease component
MKAPTNTIKSIKQYASVFRIRFSNTLQYRAAAYAGMATQFAWGGLEILMFSAFYRTNPAAFPMEFSHLTSYIWLQQACLALFMVWFTDNEIFDAITSGNIAYELTRPADLYSFWFTKNVAVRLSKAVLRCFPILIIAALLPHPYGISLPANIGAFAMFIATSVLAMFAVVGYGMLIYTACFYTISARGIRIAAVAMSEFLTGALIPLPFFPDKLRVIFEHTPFGSMQNVPLRVYSGDLSGGTMWYYVGVQLFWVVVLIAIGRFWMKHALRRVVVQGG